MLTSWLPIICWHVVVHFLSPELGFMQVLWLELVHETASMVAARLCVSRWSCLVAGIADGGAWFSCVLLSLLQWRCYSSRCVATIAMVGARGSFVEAWWWLSLVAGSVMAARLDVVQICVGLLSGKVDGMEVAAGMVAARVWGEIRVSHGRDEDDDMARPDWFTCMCKD